MGGRYGSTYYYLFYWQKIISMWLYFIWANGHNTEQVDGFVDVSRSMRDRERGLVLLTVSQQI